MRTPSLPLLPGPIWSGMLAPGKVLLELNCVHMLNWIVWNRTAIMYEMDLVLNNLQWLNAIKPNQTKPKHMHLYIYIYIYIY